MLRLQSAPTRAHDWINQNKIEYAIQYIVRPLRMINTSSGQSENFANLWDVEDTGFLKLDIVNYHERAIPLEFGWGPFDVYPKGKDNGGADVLRFEIDGEVIYAMEAHPKGFIGYNTLLIATRSGIFRQFFEALVDGANEWLQKVKMK